MNYLQFTLPIKCEIRQRRSHAVMAKIVPKQRVAWISDDYFESFSALYNVWIDHLLMPSSDVTTRRPGSDFDWLIIQTFA